MLFGVWQNNALAERLTSGQPFALNGTRFPGEWLQRTSPAEQTAYGIYPITMSGVDGDTSVYVVSESAPTFDGSSIRISYINTPKNAATVASIRLVNLAAQVNSVFNTGVTVGAKTYAADPASLLSARQAISDVSAGLTTTSYISALDGSVTAITVANVAAARTAMVTFITAVGAKRLSYYNQIQSFSASGDTSSLLTLDLTQGWPS